jgi:hypothetical protein
MTKEERWYSTDAFVATCTAVAKITEATGGMVATIDEINTFQELLKQQGFSILPKEYPNQDKWISVDSAPKDGTKIIGYDPNTEEIYIVWWNRHMGYGCWNYSGNQYIPKISHWQKLPNPPKQ